MDGGSLSPFERFSRHGGRLDVARTLFAAAPTPWIDLSTGINPHSYDAPHSSAAERARLPDPLRVLELERTAAQAFGVADPRRVIAAPGTELALRLLPILVGGSSAAVVTPTYSSHADAWRRAGAAIAEVSAPDIDASRHDVVVIVNPNNPDGTRWERERLLDLHDHLRRRRAWLVVDEAFIDVDPSRSICGLAGSARAPNLLALRSFGKFYGLAGVRLGFVIGCPSLTDRLRSLIGDWPLSADALATGLAAYADDTWARDMREKLAVEAHHLDDLLSNHGLEIVGGTSLFRLARSPHAGSIFERLLRAGILVRPFAYDTTLLRFGLPGAAIAWRRLAAALGA
jgi:cobalamin biosynthetic protein CobC